MKGENEFHKKWRDFVKRIKRDKSWKKALKRFPVNKRIPLKRGRFKH